MPEARTGLPGVAAAEAAVAMPAFLLRGTGLVLLVLYGLLIATIVRLDFSGRLRPEPVAAHWSRLLLRLLGARVTVRGTPRAGALVVANHISWLDIPLMCTALPARFISKSEVQRWPVAGWLADAAGTFYLRRGAGGSRPLLNALTPFLRGGGTVVLYPEGTTTDGAEVLPFHPRLFSAALEAQLPVQPVALRYGLAASGESVAPFIGDDDLVSHLLRLLRNPGLAMTVVIGEPMPSTGASREQLATGARDAIRHALGLPAEPVPLVAPRVKAAA